MSLEQIDDKKKQIIEAAIKRFSHFGIAKTTMSEIADDISISKANLYYYFTDKWALVDAIMEQLQAESEEYIEEILRTVSGVEQILTRTLDIKLEFFNKYKLLIQNLNQFNVQDPQFRKLAERSFESERATTAKILELGIKSGQLETIDILETSNLYTAVMRGLGLYCFYQNPTPFVNDQMLDQVNIHQRHFIRVFIHGITKKNQNN